MKFIIATTILLLSIVTTTNDDNISLQLNQKPEILEITVAESMAYGDDCFGHGGLARFGTSWILGTCRSQCNRGIGFRCGRETYVICQDGTEVITGRVGSSCPDVLVYEARMMSATITFYNNNTLKFTFQKPLPEEENENNDFEIEENTTIGLPGYLLIGGRRYTSATIRKGIFRIDRANSRYGDVIVDMTLDE